ncbi:DUF1700 domain-containing protein [Streptomyces sp. NPDC058000]|uniref:DUF1700 domain-containing protein n=1 Tax=Streptomyces sp. NPDC058000 TaxID=3346299 RepID=UPI0036E67EBB
MTISDHPLVKKYLAAVGRESAGLSPERRKELLADLEEHIAVALAEESASGDDEIRSVLARLGDPRTIAATALGEELPAPHVSRGRTLALLGLLAVTGPLTVFGPVLGIPALIGAIWWLWTAAVAHPRQGARDGSRPRATAVPDVAVDDPRRHAQLRSRSIPPGPPGRPSAPGLYLLWAARHQA